MRIKDKEKPAYLLGYAYEHKCWQESQENFVGHFVGES
jgi:hypothetical protein